jgi:hypothetical protein
MRGPGVGFAGFTVSASARGADGGASAGIALAVKYV